MPGRYCYVHPIHDRRGDRYCGHTAQRKLRDERRIITSLMRLPWPGSQVANNLHLTSTDVNIEVQIGFFLGLDVLDVSESTSQQRLTRQESKCATYAVWSLNHRERCRRHSQDGGGEDCHPDSSHFRLLSLLECMSE